MGGLRAEESSVVGAGKLRRAISRWRDSTSSDSGVGVAPRPNLFLAGAPKCGTTSLFTWLDLHPAVAGSVPKEPRILLDASHPWCDPSRSIHSIGWAAYNGLFPTARPDTQVLLDGTPEYLDETTPLDALDALPRVIFCLRDPAERLLSLLRFAQENVGSVDRSLSFRQVVQAIVQGDPLLARNWRLRSAIDHGRYVRHLVRWRERYPLDRIRVVRLDDLRSRPRQILSDLAAWIDIDPSVYETAPLERANESIRVRSVPVHRLAQAVRAVVPQGAGRRRLTRLYRRVNTRALGGPSTDVPKVLEDLRHLFRADNERLADEWGVDVTPWLPSR